ncbi:MAG: recombinase [Acidobacteria bacterium]|nr:MAG: recombinase [Acidobacteriota bacterium]
MSLAIAFRPEAEPDVLAAHDWYEQQQSRLGSQFVDALSILLDRIKTMAGMYVLVFRDARRAKLRTFPYLIYYRVLTDRIEVLAVLHGSRDPRLWQERIN